MRLMENKQQFLKRKKKKKENGTHEKLLYFGPRQHETLYEVY